MKFLVFLSSICFLSLSTAAEAATLPALGGGVSTVVDGKCREDVADVNDLGYRFTDNSQLYKGKCVDGSRFRPIKNLVISSDLATFNNYGHDNQFWQAQLPLTKLATVYFHVQRFAVVEGVVAAHTELRFVFKDKGDVKLTQKDKQDATQDILVSFEAAFPKEVGYNFALGAFPNYARVAKIMSTLQKQNDSTATMEQYELNLSQDEMVTLLKTSLQYSQKISIEEFYNTLRPNCTTEAFDLIDLLPRFKGKYPPFLTMISPDPIAGPSIDALQKRKLIKQRVQDYADELKGVAQILPVPETKSSMTTFLPDVAGRPWTLTTVLPDTSSMTPAQKKVIESLREQLILSIPALVQNYGSVMMLTPDEQKGQALFINTFKSFVQQLPAFLRKINSELPEEATNINMYFAPYESAATSTSLTGMGIPAQIPFALNDYQLDDADKYSQRIFYDLAQGIIQAGETGADPAQKAFLMGAALLLKAQKDQSTVTTQLIAGLDALESNMEVVDKKVNIHKVVVPKGNRNIHRPSMLINHFQEVSKEELNENMDVQFGSFGGLGGTSAEYGFASLQIDKGFDCNQQANATPYLEGSLTDQFTGIGLVDFLVQGQSIRFHIMRMSLNLKTQKVDNMNLAISTLGFNCINNKDAEVQFTESANKAIADLINKAGSNPLLQKLSPLLN
jgi:hypothetical protein